MKVFNALILAAAATSGLAIAVEAEAGSKDGMHGMNGMMGMMQSMQAMDGNGDHMISRGEFLTAHEAMFDAMKKNAAGLVDIKDMPCAS